MSNTSDFSKPQVTDPYVDVTAEINALASDLAQGLDPATTNPANLPVGAVRFNSANGFWEKFNGTAWSALAAVYNVVAAQAKKLQQAVTLALTGDITGSASFDGSGNVSIAATLPNVNPNPGTAGDATTVPVLTTNAKGQVTAVASAAIAFPSSIAGNAGTVSTLGGASGGTVNGNLFASNPGGEAQVGAVGAGQNPAYLYNNASAWGLYSASGGSIVNFNRSNNHVVVGGVDTTAIVQNNGGTYGINISGNAATASRAHPLRADGAAWDLNWSGQGGQPTWLVGSNDGANFYVWNPSNFSVNYASTANYARTAGSATVAASLANCNCNCTCFPAGTRVLMADGTQRSIETLRPGDRVMGADGKPVAVLAIDRPLLGDRRMLTFNDASLLWSEEHALWTCDAAGKQWWWSANPDRWRLEAAVGAIRGLKDNGSLRTGQGHAFAHLEGWRERRVVEAPGFGPATPLYLPLTGGVPIVVGGYVAGAGVDEWGFDYAAFRWDPRALRR